MRSWLPATLAFLLFVSLAFAVECEYTGIFAYKEYMPTLNGKDDARIVADVKSNLTGSIYSPNDTIVSFDLYDYQTKQKTTLCSGLNATKEILEGGNVHYYYNCTVDSSLFSQKCVDVTVKILGPLKYCPAQETIQVCDFSSTTMFKIVNYFNYEMKNAINANFALCIIGFILLGTLLATMFYSGKSPMSLLDITTPNLPSPKSTAASGQLLGQMVYGRMKRIKKNIMADQMAGFQKIGDDLSKKLEAKGRKSTIDLINSLYKKARGDDDTKNILKFIALKMAENPGEFTDQNIRDLFRNKSLIRYSEQEYGELGRIIQRMRKMARTQGQKITADKIDEFLINYTYLNKMEMLTGESGERRGVMDFLYKLARAPADNIAVLSPYFGGIKGVKKVPLVGDLAWNLVSKPILGKLPIIGSFYGTAVDAFFRSARITGRYGQVVAGSLARVTMGIKGEKIKNMSQQLEQDRLSEAGTLGYGKRLLYSTLTAGAPESTKLGGMFPIQHKMSEMYRTLNDETHYDAMVYIMRRMYAKYGVNLGLTEMEIAQMPYNERMDVLQLAGLRANAHASQIHAMEAELRRILSRQDENHFENLRWKVDELKTLAARNGVSLDHRMDDSLARVRQIHDSGESEHVKMVMIYNYLRNEHHTADPNFNPDDPAHVNKFNFNVGRDNLGSNIWSTFNLRKMIFSAEGAPIEGTGLFGGLEEMLKESWLYVVNRTRGLALEGEMKNRINEYMTSLLTEEGKRVAKEFEDRGVKQGWKKLLTGAADMKHQLGGDNRDILVEFGDYGRPSLLKKMIGATTKDDKVRSDRIDALDSTLDKTARKLFPTFMKGGVDIGYYDKNGAPIMWGEESEIGPRPGWWKVDMKRDWLMGATGIPHEKTLGYYVEGLFEKGFRVPYKASIYRELEAAGMPVDQTKISKKFAEEQLKPRFLRDALVGELYDFINGTIAMNAYKYTNETMRFYLKTAQAILVGSVVDEVKNKKDGDTEFENAKRRASEIERLDLSTADGIHKLSEALRANSDAFSKYLSKPVTYDMFVKSRNAWVMLHEGGFAPYVHGMPLSDFDRVMGGYVSLKDSEGKWRRYDPQRIDMKFEGPEGLQLKREFAALQNQKDKMGSVPYADETGATRVANWNDLLTRMGEWAKGSYERQKIYNAALWKYAQITEDWHGFWEKSEITIRPKHEVMGIRVQALPYGSHSEMPSTIMEPVRKARELLREVGMWVERSSIYSAGAVYKASYEINPISEYARERFWDSTRQLRQYNATQLGLSQLEYDALRMPMKHYSRYHLVWDFGIDRNPMKHSTSYGLQNAMASYFHYGPAAAWDPSWYKPFFDKKAEYYAFESVTGSVRLARYLALPAITAFRSFQMTLFGYPNKWNYQEGSPMQPWQYRNPDLIGAFRSIANPFYASLNWGMWGSQEEKDAGNWGGAAGDMIRRDMGGAKYRRGLKPVPAEFSWIYKGHYSVAREGEANPGISLYDSRRTLHLSSTMAEYMLHRDRYAGYFAEDEYVRKRGYNTYIKREVGAPALAIRREEELRGFSPFANALYAWTNPGMFMWHLPFSPISPRDMYMHWEEGKRRMEWEKMSTWDKTKQVVTGGGGGMLPTVWSNLKPTYNDESGRTKMYGGGMIGARRDLVACPLCGSQMQRWGSCAKCRRRGAGAGAAAAAP